MKKISEPGVSKLCTRCGRPLPLDAPECAHCGLPRSGRYHRRSTVLITWIISSVALFVIATLVSHGYEGKREALADRWFERGSGAMANSQPEVAISDFRNALAYSSRNPRYRLQLAEALLAAGRTQEARDYFESLWQEDPSDGRINLALARLQARRKNIPQAIRYYHGAVYGEWQQNPLEHREQAQFELVKFLLDSDLKSQAQSELLTLAQEAPNDPPLHLRVAKLLAQADDFENALAESRKVLQAEPENADALATAGTAAFEVGQYGAAEQYLRKALEGNHKNPEASALLDEVRLMQSIDPYQRGLSLGERHRRVIQAFDQAGARLQGCAQQQNVPLEVEHPSADLQKLYGEWTDLSSGMNDRFLRQRPDLADSAMDLVFRIEQRTKTLCGAPTGSDQALLLIGQEREETAQ